MMTRNDFENVALMFATQYAELKTRDYLSEVTRDFMETEINRSVYGMARIGVLNNRRFNVSRFLTACGMRADMVPEFARMVDEAANQYFGPFRDGSGMVTGS